MSDVAVMRLALPLYFALYIGVAFVLRSWIVWRQTGINPVVIGTADDIHGCVGRWMRLTIGAITVVVMVFALAPALYTWLGPFARLERPLARTTGGVLLASSFLWTVLAQRQMGAAWRIGVPRAHRTPLVERGLFSRNPIFLGMIATLAGLFLVLPSTATLVIMVVGVVVIELQVRVEEDHLLQIHGAAYAEYRGHVPRWLGWPSLRQPPSTRAALRGES